MIGEALKGAGIVVPVGESPVQRKARSAMIGRYRRKFDRHHIAIMDGGNAPGGVEGDAQASWILLGRELAAYERFVKAKKEKHVMEFSDQIGYALEIMRGCGRVRSMMHDKFPHVLCDEGQDLGASDLALLRALGDSCTIVGDGDQEIFGFKNGLAAGKWQALDQVARLWDETEVLQLAENRRCPPTVVAFSSAVIRNNGGEDKNIVALKDEGEPVRIVGAANLDLEVEYVAAAIQKIVISGGSYSDCVIISRRNRSLGTFRKLLAKFDPSIPLARSGHGSQVKKDPSGLMCDEVVDFMSLLLPNTGLEAAASRVADLCGMCLVDVEDAMTWPGPAGNRDQSVSEMAALREWHVSHKDDSEFGPLLREYEELEKLVSTDASLASLIRRSVDAIRKLGISDGDPDDEIPSQTGDFLLSQDFSQPTSDIVESSAPVPNGRLDFVAVAEKMDVEAMRLRDAAYLDEQNAAAYTKASENVEDFEDDDFGDEFLSLVSGDLRRQENMKRSQKGVSPASASQSSRRPQSAPAATPSGSSVPKERLDFIGTFVFRARNALLLEQVAENENASVLKPAVDILTIHKAKGGEWRFVFVVDCTGDNFPVEGLSGQCSKAHIAAERRIFFVASTRAKERLTMTFSRHGLARFASRAEIYKSASPFFSEGFNGVNARAGEREKIVTMTDVCGKVCETKRTTDLKAEPKTRAAERRSNVKPEPLLLKEERRVNSKGGSSRLSKKPRTA